MTSTNDGKDVKSNQISGPKGKSYYIELYKSLEAQLSGECELPARTQHLCEAWRRVHSLCQQSAASTHPHLLNWLQRHTARTVLQSEWQSPKNKSQHSNLENAINAFIQECQTSLQGRDGNCTSWESQLLQRAEWFKSVLSNPWGHPVLKVLLDPKGDKPSDEQILEWLKEERGVMFVTRLRQLSASKCDDLALSLTTAVMDRVRASDTKSQEQSQTDGIDKVESQTQESPFAKALRLEAGFTADVWDLLTDIELVLLHKYDGDARCIQLAKLRPLRTGYPLVERLRTRLEISPKEKRLWKNAKDVATLVAQVIIARCMVVSACSGACRAALYLCARALARMLGARLPAAARPLAAPAATARHLHTLATAAHAQCEQDMRPFVCELYVRAITAGMNELERLKLQPEKEPETRSMESTLAEWFMQLGTLLSASGRVRCECLLTAFSVHPTPAMYEHIRQAPLLPAMPVYTDTQEIKQEIKSEFGSWATDSRSQTNFVKTSETLNLKQIQNQANVLSTAILTEGETLGLSTELCQDLAVLLSGPRVKTLSWDMRREDLLDNGRVYMERTHGGTKALTTELKYLNLDPKHYEHLPEEEDEENDMYYGIEKGYEHLVECQEPEEIWQNVFWQEDNGDVERTETAYSSCTETETEYKPRRNKKTKAHPISSDEDCDPLSLVAEEKRNSEKKERPHSKERSKSKKSSSWEPAVSKEHRRERRKDGSHSVEKKGRKPRKTKEKTDIPPKIGSLSNLLGMKVTTPSRELEKIHKKERRRSDNQRNHLSITDSDYDSQGKSSLNSDGNDPYVLFDGLFSMDEIKSPERMVSNDKETVFNSNNEFNISNGKVAIIDNKVSSNIIATQGSVIPRVRPKTSMWSTLPSDDLTIPASKSQPNINKKESSEEVKKGIVKLINFRRQKSSINKTNGQNTVGTLVKDNQSIPGSKNITNEHNTVKNISKLQPLIGAKVLRPAELPKVYVNTKTNRQQTDNRNESNTIIGLLNNDGKITNQYSSKVISNTGNETILINKNISNRQAYAKQTVFKKQHIIDHTVPDVIHKKIANTASHQPVHNVTKYEQPTVNSSKAKSYPKCFEDFLKELQESINAGTTGRELSEHKTVNQHTEDNTEDNHTIVRHTPYIPSGKADLMSPQCAKHVQTKKPEYAPNTFARLSYMHKNKQTYSKPKQTDQITDRPSQLSKIDLLQLEHNITEHKISKMKLLNKQNLSALATVRFNNCAQSKSKDTAQNFVKQYEKPTVVETHPVLSNLLETSQSHNKPMTKPDNLIQEHNFLNNKIKCQTSISISNSNKGTLLSEKDQQDLLTLLQQKSKFNPPVSHTYTELLSKIRKVEPPVSISNSVSVDVKAPSSEDSTEERVTGSLQSKADLVQLSDSNFIQIPDIKRDSVTITRKTIQTKPVKNITSLTVKPNTIQEKNVYNEKDIYNTSPSKDAQYCGSSKLHHESEQEWKSVMDAILAHKTPSRGPNALDIALMKSSYDKQCKETSLRNQRIVRAKPVGDLVGQISVDVKQEQMTKPIKTLINDRNNTSTKIIQHPKLIETEPKTPINSNHVTVSNDIMKVVHNSTNASRSEYGQGLIRHNQIITSLQNSPKIMHPRMPGPQQDVQSKVKQYPVIKNKNSPMTTYSHQSAKPEQEIKVGQKLVNNSIHLTKSTHPHSNTVKTDQEIKVNQSKVVNTSTDFTKITYKNANTLKPGQKIKIRQSQDNSNIAKPDPKNKIRQSQDNSNIVKLDPKNKISQSQAKKSLEYNNSMTVKQNIAVSKDQYTKSVNCTKVTYNIPKLGSELNVAVREKQINRSVVKPTVSPSIPIKEHRNPKKFVHSYSKTIKPEQNITSVLVANSNVDLVHNDLRIAKPEQNVQTRHNKIQKSNQAEAKKLLFVSDVQNSEYDLIEELMDDDLRQEIGELSSDEEVHPPVTTALSKNKANFTLQRNNSCNKPITTSGNIHPKRTLNLQERTKQIEAPITKIMNNPPKTCLRNPTIGATPEFRNLSEIRSICVNSNGSNLNKTMENTSIQILNTTLPISKNIAEPKSNNESCLLSTNIVNNNQISANAPQVYIGSQHTALQNVLVIGSELIYEPYPTIQIQDTQITTNLSGLTQNAYVTVNGIPNITVFQSTQFAAPIANPVIIGNATTAPPKNVSKVISTYNNVQSMPNHSDLIDQNILSEVSIKLNKHNQLNPKQVIPNEGSNFELQQCNNISLIDSNNKPGNIVNSDVNLNHERNKLMQSDSSVNQDKQDRHNQKFGADGTVFENTTKPHHCSKVNRYQEDTKLVNKVITDYNLNKNKERKVLSEVQEKLKLYNPQKTDNYGINYRLTLDNDTKEEQERLKNKRLAIINRKINNHTFYPPIPLTYIPLNNGAVDESDKPNSISNIMNDSILHLNVIDKPQTIKSNEIDIPETSDGQDIKHKELNDDHSKENNNLSCRRILLRSSNELKDTVISSITNQKNVIGRKRKVRLKKSSHMSKKQNVIDNVNEQKNVISNKESVNSTRRASKRIKNKPTQKMKLKQTVNVSEIKCSKNIIQQNYIDQVSSSNIPTFIDIESELVGSVVLKTKLPEKSDHCETPTLKTKPPEAVTDNIEKPTLECDKNSENKLVVEKDKSNEILGKGENMDNIDKNNKIKEIQDNKSDSLGDPKSVSSWKDKRECVRKRGEDIKITTLNKAKLINNNIIKDITKSPSGPLVNKDNYKDTDKRNLKNPLITNTSVGGVIRNFNEMDKVESEPEPNRYQSKGDTPNSENDIIIEEIKTNNVSGSLKRQLHVKLPNKQNKSFKVTICSESSSNFDCNSLFSHGAFKSFLSKNSNTVSKFSLNIKHDPRNSDTNKISEISIHEIFTHKSTMGPNARGIEVVDLLSDDENGDELLFKTEFGYYAIKNLDQNIFQKHQKKFTQKCTVKVNKYKAKNTYKDKQNNLCENNGQSSKNGKCTTTSDDIISLSSDEAISDNDIDGPLIPCQYSDTVKISSTQLEDDKLIVNDIHKIQRALEFVEIDDSSDDDDAPGNKVNILHNLDIESEESSETNRNTTTNINCPLSFPKYDDLNQKHKNNKTHPCYINLVRCDDLLKIRNKLENETVEVSEDSPAFPTIELSGDSPTSESENSPIFPTIKLSEDSSAFPTTKISEDTLVSETEDSPASPTIEFSEDSPASPIIELSENSPASPTIEFSEESPPSPTGSFSILQDYTFSDEHLPAEEIFVVPVGIDSSLITYSRNFDITESQNKLLNYRETGAISHNSIKQPPKVLIYECEWFITKSMLSYYQGLTFVSNSKSTTHSSSILENNNTRESISDCSIVDSNKDVRSTQTLTVPTLLQMLTNFVNNSDFECNLPRVHQQVQNSIEIPPRKLKRKLIASKESNTKIKIPKKYVIAEIQETTVQEIQEMSKIYSYTDNENCERNVTESFESNNLSIRNVDNCPNGNPDTLICNGTVDKEMKNNLLNEDFIGNEMNVDGVLMNKDTNQDVSEEPINESEELNVEAVHSYAKAVENSKSQSIQFTNTSDSNMKDVIKCDIQNIDQCQIKRTQTDNATTINKEQNERHLCESSKNINNVLLQEQTIIDVIENNVLCENSLTNNHTIPDQLHINNVPIANGESRGICDESGKSSFTFDEDSVNNEKEIINNSCESITNVPTFNNSSKNDVKCETSGESSNHTDDIVHRDEGPKSTKICNDAKLLNTNTIIEQPNELLSVEISNGNNSSSKILEKSPFNDAIYNKLTDSTVPVPNSTDVQLQDIEIAHVVHKNNILNTGMAPNTAEEKVDATESNTNALRRNSLDSNVELSNRDVEIAKSPILKCQPIILKYRYPVLGKYYTVPYTKAASLSIKNSCVSDNTEKVIKVVPILNNDKFTHENNAPEKFHEDFEVNLPNATYKKKSLKRKLDMRHVKTTGKKYRKAKNIDNGIITANSIRSSGLRDEFNRLFNYYNSVKFSYSQSFLKEQINVHELLKDWPIQGTCDDESPTKIDNNLFEDMKNIQRLKYIGDPLNLSLPEEITAEYVEINDPSIEINEINFNTGFGDVSDRVIQNLEHCGDVSKFSAAALSDVKQYQPLLLSEECNNNENTVNFQKMYTDQIEKIKRHITYLQIKNYVQLFFKNTRVVLSYKRHDTKRPYGMYNTTKLIFDLCKTIYVMPPQPNCAVHVVQVGQLPVSAAAQNPVTCDPRVTQVSDASPPQCSVENSPSSDSQTTTRTQYTELTTADITLPIVQEYVQQSQMTIENQEEDVMMTDRNISIDVEIKSDEQEMKEELEIKEVNNRHESNELKCLSNTTINNIEFPYDTSTSSSNSVLGPEHNVSVINSRNIFNSTDQVNRKQSNSDNFLQEKEQAAVKLDQIAHAMNAAGISTTVDTEESVRVQTLVNALAQKLHQNSVNNTQTTSSTTYAKSTSINAMALQQALAQILPPPLNQTNGTENSQPLQNTPVTSQVLHIVQGKNASGNQITLVDNTQQSVINTPNATQVLHIVQNKTGTSNTTSNGPSAAQSNPFSALSLVDAGLQRGGNQLLHIVNTGNQKNNTGQILKRVNLLTNLQGSNEQKVVQFVCKSADGKSINLNAPHQRSMVLRLQPIDSSNVQPVQSSSKPESQEINVSSNPTSSVPLKENITTQQEIKSRSVFEENYAKFVQNSSPKLIPEKSTSLPKFNQAFGKPVFQDDNQKHNDINSDNSHLPPVNTNDENPHCPSSDNTLNLEHMGQMGNPPLLLKKTSTQTSQSQPNLVQQIKQTITPMNIQTMHGGVIYTRQIPVNIGGGQTINLITVPSTELVEDSAQKHQSDVKFGNQNEIEPSIIKIMPQGQTAPNPETSTEDTSNNHLNTNNENAQQAPPQPPPQVLTQMRIKLPMLSKTPQMVSGARVVRPSFLQIQRNVIGGANQSVYQQLVLTAAPPLGQQSIRLPQTQTQPLNQTPTQPQAPTQQQTQTQANRPVKVQPESQSSQSSSESQMSSSTLEQLREFDMVLEQVKERSTVQPNTSSNSSYNKIRTPSSDTTDSTISPNSSSTESSQQVLYSMGSNSSINVPYSNRKTSTSTPTTSTFVRSPDSSGIADSPTSSSHIPHTVTSESSSNEQPTKPKKSKSRPKSSSHPNSMKLSNIPPKTSTQKPLEDEQTTQRILYILAEYKEQVENSPDKDKPAPRRRNNIPTNPANPMSTNNNNNTNGNSKRKKSSSSCRRSGRELSPLDDGCRTMGSEDSSCGTSQGDCTESCLDSHSPQDSPRKVVRRLTFEQESPVTQVRTIPHRNVIVADGQTITVARGAGKPTTAVLMPANYILPVSMVKSGQQIAIVTNRGPKLLTVGGGEGGTTNALLLQRLIGPGLKPVLARPGVRHVRLPAAALHNLQTLNLATATTVNPPERTASSTSAPTPPDLVDTRATSSPWTDRVSQDIKPDRCSSPEGSEPWNLVTSDPQDYSYEETVRTDNMDRTVLDPIPDRYSPDMEAQRIFDKMFDVDSKRCYDDSPRCGYDIDPSDCDDNKAYHQVVQRRDGPHRQHRLTHVSAAALRHKYAILEHELRLQKSLSEECEDLGVDSPSASELFPEADLLFATSPAHDHTQEHGHHSHTPQPTTLNQSNIPQPDIDDQIATDQLLTRDQTDRSDLGLGLEDVGIVTVSEDGMRATIELDQEEFARSHPNTTFHRESSEEGMVQPFTITNIKGRHITSVYHTNTAPATVLMSAPQATVISQATTEASNVQNAIKYTDIDNMINSLPQHNNDINLSSVLVNKDEGLTRFDGILTDSRELHLSNTASAIVHSTGNATQVIRRVCYDDDKRQRESRFIMEDPVHLIAGDDAKMIPEDSGDPGMEPIGRDMDDDRYSPERHAELFWESNSASERSESRRPLDFSSDSDKCCKSPYNDTNSTDSSGVGTHMRLDSVIKEARGRERSGSADGSSDDMHPPLRTYPPKRSYHLEAEVERSLSGKTRAGELSPDISEVRRRASGRGVVKRGCHCCNGSPAPPRAKKPRIKKTISD